MINVHRVNAILADALAANAARASASMVLIQFPGIFPYSYFSTIKVIDVIF